MSTEKHRLQLMGAFAAAAPLSRKARALLAYLALNADTPVSRERLCGLLWSERGEEQARGSLRQCLQELRPFASGPAPLIGVNRVEVTLWGDRAITDLDEIRALAAAGDAVGLADRLSGVTNRLLANLDGLDPAFDEWLTLQRAAIDNQIMAEAMACSTAVLTTAPRDSLRLAQAIRAREPLDEAAARLAMTAAHAAGEQGEVRRIWRRLEDDLKRELDVQPSAETAACFAELQTAGEGSSQPAARRDAPMPMAPDRAWLRWFAVGTGLTVALAALVAWLWVGHQPPGPSSTRVERLQSPVGDAAAALFADGIAGDLALMAQARQSTLRIVEPGAPGGASPRFTVDGRVRSVAGRLNATLELHLASDGSIIWSATFDRPMADEADMRRGAALKLADVLTCAVHDGDQASKDVEVLKLFLAACEDIHSGAGPETVRDLFRKVVARAPNFARGWTELAVEDALVAQFRLDALGRETTERDAARALALDPRQARAWVARALVAWRADEWVRRDADLRRALAIEPDEPLALAARAYALRAIGRGRDDLAVRRQAVIADPLSAGQLVDLALDEGLQGDVAGANATLDEAERRSPGYPAAGGERLFVAALVGDPNAARRLLDDPSNRQQMTSLITEYLRRVIAARADPKQADQAAAFILAHAGDLGLLNTIQGLAEVGHVDQALDVVQSNVGTLAKEMDWTYGFYTEPLTRLRASPRFMPLAARIGLVDIWRQTGLWPDFCTAPDRPYDCKAEAQKLAKG